MAKTGLTATSPGAAAGYARTGGTPVQIPLVPLSGPTAPWTAGGFCELSPSITPGLYRLDVPDAALAPGAPLVSFTLNFTGVLGEGALALLQSAVSNVGPGALAWTITVVRADTLAPLAGASVWVSTDSDGLNVVAGAISTGVNGQVTFLLNQGNYFLWVVCSGFLPTNPTAFGVSGPGGLTVTLPVAAPAPALVAAADHTPRTTAADMVERLLDFAGADPSENAFRQARRAINDSLRVISAAHKWTYLQGVTRIQLLPRQTAGTIEFLLASGTYPRQLTLTGATWPPYADGVHSAQVRIGGIAAALDHRISDTVVTLKESYSLVADVPAGSGYDLYFDSYTLPEDYVGSHSGLCETMWGGLEYLSPAAYLARQRYSDSWGQPGWWTVLGDSGLPGRLCLKVWPYPDTDYGATLDLMYQRRLRPIHTFASSEGTATIEAGANPNLVTLSYPVLTAAHRGSVIRLAGSAGPPPTDASGLNPWVLEGNITTVQSPSSCLIDTVTPTTWTGVSYLVSDPVDFEDLSMNLVFARCAEFQFATSRLMESRGDAKGAYLAQLRLAQESDARVHSERAAAVGGWRGWRRLAFMPRDGW